MNYKFSKLPNDDECCGCQACANVCPKDAIAFSKRGGFYAKSINASACINCGMCTELCPNLKANIIQHNEPIKAFSFFSSSDDIVESSSSGGAFSHICNSFSSGINNFSIYSAAYDSQYDVIFIEGKDELHRLRKSKYVESFMGYIYRNVKSDLKDGKKVLFCGSPCQVAGLFYYLKNSDINMANLLLVDFSCGGFQSITFYHLYLRALERKNKSKIVSLDFRPKTFGWKTHAIRVKFENGKVYNQPYYNDPYLRIFLLSNNIATREYCHECRYAINHFSDITLADFWLADKFNVNSSEKGISLILCNTGKGVNIVRALSEAGNLEEVDVHKAKYNNIINTSSDESRKKRKQFVNDMLELKFDDLMKKYLPKESFFIRTKNVIKRILKK